MLFRNVVMNCLLSVGVLACADDSASQVDGRSEARSDGSADSRTDAGNARADARAATGCTVRADCIGSVAETEAMTAKCPRSEFYCSEGECVAECRKPCEAVRTDSNPCGGDRLCANRFCTILPVACTNAGECPLFVPADATGSWGCESGVCALSGYSYAAQ